MFKQEEMLQPKIYEKQENRSKSGERGEMLQSERVENQADWGENSETREKLQLKCAEHCKYGRKTI